MAKIKLSEPDGPYSCEIDTDVMNVLIKEAFLGVGFETKDGEKLSVCMRDSGFEIRYSTSEFDTGWIKLDMEPS